MRLLYDLTSFDAYFYRTEELHHSHFYYLLMGSDSFVVSLL